MRLNDIQEWLATVCDSMGKRKAKRETNSSGVVETPAVEVSWPKVATGSVSVDTSIETVGQVALQGLGCTRRIESRHEYKEGRPRRPRRGPSQS